MSSQSQALPQAPEGETSLYAVIEALPAQVVGEIASPSTASYDRNVKMPRYAHYGVPCVWIADPGARTVEAYELRDGTCVEIARFGPDEPIVAQPFEVISIEPPWV